MLFHQSTGRYKKSTEVLSQYFSEYALIRYRVLVEVEYLILLLEQNIVPAEDDKTSIIATLKDISSSFNEHDGEQIKRIESTTNHDVKAVEYFIREKLKEKGYVQILPFVHFGLTSQDINNTAFPLMIKHSIENVILPGLVIFNMLQDISEKYSDIPMFGKNSRSSSKSDNSR